MSFVITGIGTDVGKTVVSAILAQKLQSSYWKPIQSGDLDQSDSIKIQNLTSGVKIIPESLRLSQPLSPHAAARIDGVEISIEHFEMPNECPGIIEGAGGLLVPLNDDGLCFIDVFKKWKLPVIVVSRHYLGSINHTLLTMEVLRTHGIPVHGIIFNGDENEATEEIILKISGVKCLGRVPNADQLTPAFIKEQAKRLHL